MTMKTSLEKSHVTIFSYDRTSLIPRRPILISRIRFNEISNILSSVKKCNLNYIVNAKLIKSVAHVNNVSLLTPMRLSEISYGSIV